MFFPSLILNKTQRSNPTGFSNVSLLLAGLEINKNYFRQNSMYSSGHGISGIIFLSLQKIAM
jgi:hypothetical protein